MIFQQNSAGMWRHFEVKLNIPLEDFPTSTIDSGSTDYNYPTVKRQIKVLMTSWREASLVFDPRHSVFWLSEVKFTSYGMITSPLSFQVLVDGSVNTLVLQKLSHLTEYIVNVYSVVGEVNSEPLKGTETTCEYFLFTSVPSCSVPDVVCTAVMFHGCWSGWTVEEGQRQRKACSHPQKSNIRLQIEVSTGPWTLCLIPLL